MVVQCCICKRIRSKEQWLELPLLEAEKETVRYTYCPECVETVYRKIYEYNGRLPHRLLGVS